MSIWHISTTIVNVVQIWLGSFQGVNAFITHSGFPSLIYNIFEHSGMDFNCINLAKLELLFPEFSSLYVTNYGEPQEVFCFLFVCLFVCFVWETESRKHRWALLYSTEDSSYRSHAPILFTFIVAHLLPHLPVHGSIWPVLSSVSQTP